jgi:hypothetical protein
LLLQRLQALQQPTPIHLAAPIGGGGAITNACASTNPLGFTEPA